MRWSCRLRRSEAITNPTGSMIATAISDVTRLVLMPLMTPLSAKIVWKLSRVKEWTSIVPDQKGESATTTSAEDGQDRRSEAVGDEHDRGELRALLDLPERLAAVGDEARLLAEEDLVDDHHDDPEDEQRRADRRGDAVLRRYLLASARNMSVVRTVMFWFAQQERRR